MKSIRFYAVVTLMMATMWILMSSCSTDGTVNGHEYIDLGLSVKWATCNVGASSPEEYGNYYEWGGVDTKLPNSFNGRGRVIGGTQEDVAHVEWGMEWRQPTVEEFEELIENCTWEWTEMKDTNGMKFTSKKNGKSIFLPAAGCKGGEKCFGVGEYGAYWSCSPSYYLTFIIDECDTSWWGYACRSVRPVLGPISEQADDEQEPFEEETIDVSHNTIAQVTVEQDSADHECVDLGLSVKWATCNVGASVPEEFGHYYGFGKTVPSDSSDWSSGSTIGKDLSDISGDAMYDVASASWGGEWRLPTKAEWVELIDNCTWTNIKIGNERYGMKVTSKKNGKSIILPACFDCHGMKGYDPYVNGFYWSSTPYEWSSKNGVMMYFDDNDFLGITWQERSHLCSVRPVRGTKHISPLSTSDSETRKKNNVHDYVDLGLSVKWATCNIGALCPEDFGNHYAWGEILPYNRSRMGDINLLDEDVAGDPRYDAARANWGKKWRLPTTKEFVELIDNCEWKWERINGINGMRATSKKNGKSIFFPAARHFDDSPISSVCFGYYWSSSHGDLWTDKADYLFFDDDGYSKNEPAEIGWYWTCLGGSIRPVSENSD